MKIITLTEKEFDNFAINHEHKSSYQSSFYARLMQKQGYMIHYIGFVDKDNKIHAASLILYKNIFKSFKYAYAPRGFLIDYNNTKLLQLFTSKLRRLLWKQGFIFIKIDPFIIHKIEDKNGVITKEYDTFIINSLKNFGYIHLGFNKYFEALKPRCNAIIFPDKDLNALFLSLSKKTKLSIHKASRKGITIHKGSREDIETLYKMIKNKHSRNLNYYFDYYDIFKENNMIDLYYAKINPSILLKNTRKLYDLEGQKNIDLIEKIQKTNNEIIVARKIESDKLLDSYKKTIVEATKLLNYNQNDLIIAASLVIKYNKELYFLLDGYTEKHKKYNGNHLLKWSIITNHLKDGYTSINLNGISSDLDKKNKYFGLSKFKLGFGSLKVELIGEFDLPINILLYFFFNKLKILNSILFRRIKRG